MRGFWSSVIILAVTAILLLMLAAHLLTKLGVDPFPILEHLKGK